METAGEDDKKWEGVDVDESKELTEEDVFRMKQLSVNGSQSVVSLADSTSNFGDHVPEDIEEVENVSLDSDLASDPVEVPQQRLYKGYLFNRPRRHDIKLPETVTVLKWPFGAPPTPVEENEEEWKKVWEEATVYLIGTAHYSKESQEDVLRTVSMVQPDAVMVELCPSRTAMLSLDEETLLREAKSMTTAKIMSIIKESGPVSGILHVLLISMSAHITRELSMAPGGEFRAALRASQATPHCQFILGDRPVEVTIGRGLASLSVWQKVKFFFSLMWSHTSKITPEDVEECKKADVLERLLEEMAGEFPSLSEIFVQERDRYMTQVLRTVLESQTKGKRDAWSRTDAAWQPLRVVGVVGMGHTPGIVSNWEREVDMTALLHIPPQSTSSKVTKFVIRWSITGLVAFGLFRAGRAIVHRVAR